MLDVQRLVSLGRVSAAVPSPDGTWLAVAVARPDVDNARYVSCLWRVPMDGGPAVQLTRGKADDRAPCFRRDGSLGFLSNRDPGPTEPGESRPDEVRPQVWLLPAAGGEPRPLTDEPLGVSSFRFARDADVLVAVAPALPGVERDKARKHAADVKKNGPSLLVYRQMPVRHWDHWRPAAVPCLLRFDGEGGARVALSGPEDGWALGDEPEVDVSADGRRVVASWGRPWRDGLSSYALRVWEADGSSRTLGEETGISYAVGRFSPDGRRIAAVRGRLAPERPDLCELGLFDEQGQFHRLAEQVDLWFRPCGWLDETRVLALADERGDVGVWAISADRAERLTARAAGGTHEGVSRAANGDIVGVRHRATHPPEAFRVADRPGATPVLLSTLSGFTEAEAAEIAEVAELAVPADDGVTMQGWMVLPRSEKTAPGLLWIHGGPIGAFGDGWHWRWNPLVAASAGYAVLLPNPRGSTGYGQAFIDGIWANRWGDQCYRDVLAFADALDAHPRVDGARTAAMGGSFGGYMTNWLGGNTTRFQALVTHASIWSTSAFGGVTDHPGFWRVQMNGGGFGPDREVLDRYSPERLAQHWRTPTLVIHGEKDYRCPVSEGLALFDALQHHEVPSTLAIFPDEGHWIMRPRNIIAWYGLVLDFLGERLSAGRPT